MKRKWSLFTYPVMDIKAAEAALNPWAQEGWRLEKIHLGAFASFLPAEKPVCYCIDWYDPNREDGLDYRRLLADAGWRQVGQLSYWNLYEAPAGTPPIQTDGELEYQRFRKKALRRMVIGWGFFLAMLLLLAVLAPVMAWLGLGSVWQYWLELPAKYNTAALLFLFLPFLLFGGLVWSVRLLIRLGQWKRAIAQGEPFPVPGRGSALAARLLVLAEDILLVLCLPCFVLDAITGGIGRPWMIGTIIGALIVLGTKEGIEYQRVRRYKAGMVIGAAILLIISFLPLSWFTGRLQVPSPLTGSNLFPAAEVEKREDTATFLAAYTKWTEWWYPKNLPEKLYTVTAQAECWVLPWSWLADWVTEQYLTDMGTPRPEELSGYDDVWTSGDLCLIRRGNTVFWMDGDMSTLDTQWLDGILARLEEQS